MPACHAGGREFESRPDRKSASHKDLRFCFYKQIVENESVMSFIDEINRRRTFAIVSHPDAGKTTLTEKLLLYGGAIQVAGAVKSNKIRKTATSDWMEIERQRGISVATSVMGFDYKDIKKNTFYVVNQFTFIENGINHRPDVILFINGLPLVLMELKSPSRDEVNVENAYNQIRNYIHDIPSLFYYNAICVISDLTTNKAGTITSGLDRFMEWKTKDGSQPSKGYAVLMRVLGAVFALVGGMLIKWAVK